MPAHVLLPKTLSECYHVRDELREVGNPIDGRCLGKAPVEKIACDTGVPQAAGSSIVS